MFSLKTAIGSNSNLFRFAFSRQLFLSSRKQAVDSEEPPTDANETATPITVGLEKSLF